MSHGTFSGEPETRWLTETDEEDRRMKLLAPFSFLDPDGKEWIAPVDYCVDGALIPRAVWTLVGLQYTGDYRRASVVHDKACNDAVGNSEARREADRMFTMPAVRVAVRLRRLSYCTSESVLVRGRHLFPLGAIQKRRT
jgi:Protein of unknown function (DUF1353)